MIDCRSNITSEVTLIEVGLRDGLQTEPQFVSTDIKFDTARKLIDAGIRNIQLSSFVQAQKVAQMADAEALISTAQVLNLDANMSALVLNPKGLERAIASGIKRVDISLSASTTHSQKNAGRTLTQALAEVIRMIGDAKSAGLTVRAGIQNAFVCAYEGNIPLARLLELTEIFVSSGAQFVAWADSTGQANPHQITNTCRAFQNLNLDVPLILHLHDTFGRGMSNLCAALDAGIKHFDTSFGGIGGCPFIPGASGNIATEDAVALLESMGVSTGISWEKVAKITLEAEQWLTIPTFSKMKTVLKSLRKYD